MHEHIIEFEPAYDRRDPDPKQSCGIGSVSMRWVVKGPEGAVTWFLITNWFLKDVRKEFESKYSDHVFCRPLPASLDYHSPVPMFEGQHPVGAVVIHHDKEKTNIGTEEHPLMMPPITYDGEPHKCEYLDGHVCYCDGSALAADEVYEILLKGGDKAVWMYLEERYAEQFLKKEVESHT